MKLKIAGDGTFPGTDLFNEHDEKIEGISLLKFRLYPTTGNLATIYFEVESDEMDFDVKPGPRYSPRPFVSVIGSGRTCVILKLAGDGTTSGTLLLDSEADTPIHGVTKIVWKNGTVRVWAIDVQIELKRTASTVTKGPATSPVPQPITSPSPSYGGYSNPYSYTPQTPPPDPAKDVSGQLHLNFDGGDAAQSCTHEWINASFTGLKLVCKHCNADKP